MKKFIAMLLGIVLCISSMPLAGADGEWYIFKKQIIEEDGKSHAVIKTYDESDNFVWEYKTEEGYITELDNISEIYQDHETAYFTAHGKLYALELATGKLKWTMGGVGGSNQICFDKYGNIYVSGYYGPNVIVASVKGERLYIDNDGSYCWVDKLEIVDDVLNIHYLLDDMGNDDGVKTLDLAEIYRESQKDNEIKVTLDGDRVEFDQPPVSVDERTLVPIRAVMEKMGGTVNWLPETNTTEIKFDGNRMQLVLDSTTAFYNGEAYKLDVPPQAINNRTLMPLRFVSEKFGFDVEWEAETRTVVITSIYY